MNTQFAELLDKMTAVQNLITEYGIKNVWNTTWTEIPDAVFAAYQKFIQEQINSLHEDFSKFINYYSEACIQAGSVFNEEKQND